MAESPAATANPAPKPPPVAVPFDRRRWLLRGGLVGVALVAAGLLVLGRGAPPAPGPLELGPQVLVVNVAQGSRYGAAQIWLGTGPAPAETAADPLAVAESLQVALRDASKTEVVIRAAPGVMHREVDQVRQAVQAAVPAGRTVPVQWALWKSPF